MIAEVRGQIAEVKAAGWLCFYICNLASNL